MRTCELADNTAPPPPLSVLADKAQRHFERAELNEAHETCLQALSQDPCHGRTLHLLGEICLRQGRPEQAVDWLVQARQAAAGHAGIRNSMGSAYRALGAHEQAFSAYQAAIELDPNLGEAHHNLGCLLSDLKRQQEAIQAFDRAIPSPLDWPKPTTTRGCA